MIADSKQLEKVKAEANISAPLLVQAERIKVTDEKSYLAADELRSRLKQAHSHLWDKMDEIVKPLNAALAKLYEFRRGLCGPLDKADAIILAQMQGYKKLEAARVREEEIRNAEEARKLQEKAEAQARAAEKARTPQMKARLQIKAEELQEQAIITEAAPIERVKAAHSTTRVIKRPEVTDLKAFLKGVLAGVVPIELINVNNSELVSYYKADAQTVAEFPGVIITEDIQIVRR